MKFAITLLLSISASSAFAGDIHTVSVNNTFYPTSSINVLNSSPVDVIVSRANEVCENKILRIFDLKTSLKGDFKQVNNPGEFEAVVYPKILTTAKVECAN